jgi:hypothetical protein
MKLAVKVVPGAARDSIAEWLDGTLKVRVRAQPEKGRANAALVKLLATHLSVAVRQVRIASGKTASRKIVEVDGLTHEEVFQRLGHDRGTNLGSE